MSGIRRGRVLVARLLIVAGLVGTAVGAGTSGAPAHALLLESSPKHNATGAPPPQLLLRFNGRIEQRLSRVVLVSGPHRAAITLASPEPSSPDTLVYPLPVLEPGPREARWRVLSVDGHVTEGKVRFTVQDP